MRFWDYLRGREQIEVTLSREALVHVLRKTEDFNYKNQDRVKQIDPPNVDVNLSLEESDVPAENDFDDETISRAERRLEVLLWDHFDLRNK